MTLPTKKINCPNQQLNLCLSETERFELLACVKITIYAYPICISPIYKKCINNCDRVYVPPIYDGVLFKNEGNFIIRPRVKSVSCEIFPQSYSPTTISIILYK